MAADGGSVTLSVQKPIKGVVLDLAPSPDGTPDDDAGVRWGDQALDIVPGDPQTVKVEGLKGRKVVARYLGDGSA